MLELRTKVYESDGLSRATRVQAIQDNINTASEIHISEEDEGCNVPDLEQINKALVLRRKIAYTLITSGMIGGSLSFILGDIYFDGKEYAFHIIMYVFFVGGLCGYFLLTYQNFSIILFKRLIYQINVVLILIYAIANLAIDIAVPKHDNSGLFGLMYFVIICSFLLFDCIDIKSKKLVLANALVVSI